MSCMTFLTTFHQDRAWNLTEISDIKRGVFEAILMDDSGLAQSDAKILPVMSKVVQLSTRVPVIWFRNHLYNLVHEVVVGG